MKKIGPEVYIIILVSVPLVLFFLMRGHVPHQMSGFDGYANIHRQSPMIALPGATPSLMKRAALELEKSASVSIVPFSDDESRTWHRDVYPIEFLQAAAEAEEARRIMVRDGVKEKAQIYHAKLLQLFDVYEKAIDRSLSGLAIGKPTTIASFKGTTSSAYIAEVLTYGKKNIRLMKNEEERRFKCAEGNTDECLKDMYWPVQKDTRRISVIRPRAYPLSEETIKLRDALRLYTRELYVTGEITTVQLSSSSCYPSYAPIHYDLSTHTSSLSPILAERFTLLSDAFFYDLAKIPANFSQSFLKAGATYSYQPFNVYICQDSGREMGDLLSVRHAWAYLKNNPVESVSPATKEALRGLHDAQKIFTSQEPTQRSYMQVVSTIDRILARGDNVALRLFGTREILETLRDLSLGAKTRSAELELIIGYFDDLQVSTYATGVLDPYRTSVFYMLRSGISPLLLLANETGPFLDKGSLFQTSAQSELPPTGYTLHSYERDLKGQFSLTHLLNMHFKGHVVVVQPLLLELQKLRSSIFTSRPY